MIELLHLNKSYGEKTVLRDFSAHIPQGQVTVLMGASGCGKTTLLRILMGFETPDGGTLSGIPDKIAAVFQEDRLCPDFSALSNVKLVMNSADPAPAQALLEELGLGEVIHKPVRTLSGGMQRRVSIARALSYDAPLVILDEPFKGLDRATRDAVLATVLRHTAGKTVIAVTHDPVEAQALGGQLIEMEAHS